MSRISSRLAKLEGNFVLTAEPPMFIWNPINAEDGKPAADQGDLVAIRNLRDDSRIARRNGEEEDAFRERAGREYRERCTALGQALPTLLEERE